jgi:hypothetical protein
VYITKDRFALFLFSIKVTQGVLGAIMMLEKKYLRVRPCHYQAILTTKFTATFQWLNQWLASSVNILPVVYLGKILNHKMI